MSVHPHVRAQLATIPSKPGVYLMRDRLKRVIYVGKAKALNRRLRSYFQPSRYVSLDPKTKALVDTVTDIEIHEVRNETEAILLEGKLIKQYKPKYNILFKDDKRFPLVKLTRDTYPRFILTRLQKPDDCRYFGPFSNGGALRQTMQYILKNFHIRSCHPSEPGERDYKHCHNDLIKHCSAPCIQRISVEEYSRWVQRACDFLEGKDETALDDLERIMLQAAEGRDFEKAAALRDTLYHLRTTVKQSSRKFTRDMPRNSHPSTELEDLSGVLQLPSSPQCIEGFDISHVFGEHTIGSMVQFVGGRPNKSQYRHYKVRRTGSQAFTHSGSTSLPLHQIDDYASIHEIVSRRYQRLIKEKAALPDLILIDGGRGQLNAALAAIHPLELKIPIIGIAKEEEEIIHPRHPKSIRLPPHSPALHLLQRIRDESHRFANTLHAKWRRDRIRESMLDEIDGLGSYRKSQLLKSFGSMEKIKQASLTEIQATPGMGEKTALLVWKALHPTPSKEK